MRTNHIIITISVTKTAAVFSEETVNDEQKRCRQKTGYIQICLVQKQS